MDDLDLLEPSSPKDGQDGMMRVRWTENPFGEMEPAAAEAPRAGANMYGANSIEAFCDAGPLRLTHDDADGWVDYVDNFTPLNFRYRDAGVKIWQYYEDYDNWQDTYGADAVCAFYHSGHGGMNANGVFFLPVGAAWAGNDCTAISSNMRLGNEHGRYAFFSTCESLRVLGGHSPIRTWQPANLGLRMIFGFETVSWDDPNYGKYFWQEWNKNKPFSTAWLDASWRIAHDQAPSVVACGATQQEAQDRVFNERYFSRARASTSWWWWRWYNVARTAAREPVRSLPADILTPRLRPAAARVETAEALAARFGVARGAVEASYRRRDGGIVVIDDETTIAQDPSGRASVRFGAANLENPTQIAVNRARTLAEDAVSQFALASGIELAFDRVMLASAAGGTTEGSGRLEPERVTETIVQFRQTINGLPIISRNDGVVRVAVDNDGRLTQIESSIRQVDDLGTPGRTLSPQGPAPETTVGRPAEHVLGPDAAPDHERALTEAVGRQLREMIADGAGLVGVQTVPGSSEIGYTLRGDLAHAVARRAIEVDFGMGYRKRYWIETDLSR